MNPCLTRCWACQTCSCLMPPRKLFSSFLMNKALFYMSFLLRFSCGSQAQSISLQFVILEHYSSATVLVHMQCGYSRVCWVLAEMESFDSKEDLVPHFMSGTHKKSCLIPILTTTNFILRCLIPFLGVDNSIARACIISVCPSKYLIFIALSDDSFQFWDLERFASVLEHWCS